MRLLLLLFVAICVFDPADKMLGLKVQVFVLIWVVAVWRWATGRAQVSRWLAEYVGIFIAIPALSVLWYYAYDGRQPYDGLLYMKAYLLVSLALVLNLYRIDLVPILSAVLVLLAVAILSMFAAVMIDPPLYEALKMPGIHTGLVYLDWRWYGTLTMLQAYFVTSPMLVIPIAYYFDRMMSAQRKLPYLALTGLCVAGMIAAGTRNNIFVAVLLPALLWPIYMKRPVFYLVLSGCAVALLALPFLGQLRMMLDPQEDGNSIRFALLHDYWRIFEDPATLVFGRGLGAYETWTRPTNEFMSVSELTYFEVVRNFGVPAAIVMAGLLLAPAKSLWGLGLQNRALSVAYLLFLAMSFSNPMLFNSIGILILSALLARRVPPAKPEWAFRRIVPAPEASHANADSAKAA